MKKSICLSMALFFLFGLTISVHGQTPGDCAVPDVKKGRLMTDDGVTVKFRKLTCREDTVFFTSEFGVPQKLGVKNVLKIDKTGNYAIPMAASLGAGALLGSILGTSGWSGTTLEDKKTAYIIGMTVGFTVLGGLIGLVLKKHKEIYRNPDYSFEFKVEPLALHKNARVYSVGFRVHF